MPGLGRVTPPDWEHIDKYPMAKLLRRAAPPLPPDAKHEWDVPVLYDQGQTPHCVGYSWAGFMTSVESREFKAPITFDADAIYRAANLADGLKQPHDGSTVRAGAEFVVATGATATAPPLALPGEPATRLHHEQQYLWSKTVEEVCQYLYSTSPVVIGINWYESMFDVDVDGYVRIPATAKQAGGHAILVRAVDMAKHRVTLRQSWGQWGLNGTGDAYLDLSDLERLLNEDGEASAAIDFLEVVPPKPQPTPVRPQRRHRRKWWMFW